MRSSNPVLASLPAKGQATNYYGDYQQAPTGLDGFTPAPVSTERPMTVDDVVTKTGIVLAIIVALAAVNFGIALVSPALSMGLTAVGAIGGLVTVLIATFGKKFGSAPVTLVYAAFEGLFVGGISVLFSGFLVGGNNAGAMIGQAVLGTLGVFLGMLYAYKTGAVKVTPRFTKILTGAMIGVLVLALGNFMLAILGVSNVLRDGGPIAIIFSLVCIGLAAMSFLQDFDVAEKLIRQGAPSKMAWGVALGLAVTLVWLYTEILRLLSYFSNR
ncbi:Bax inhibitor-1/YccA family protein [Corynebacterium sp. ES2715-CONJ3]|uniref:Bax inhibitor-1/YccA family protein n=1 Tax=Corynebacterium sp. ES2715-CONJ3 TaxID=2974028 RepID=UPI002167A19A|nr:Bax inhibitor-1/YccA family protein [Corynebacterium sp. ES2715-CONJ3]MCS4491693.1 Bax inhibitor-1/YccA family protein [Corynebacterium sp. ES2715-CONJ3]